MDYIEFKIWKGVVICVIVFIVAFWKGFTGQ